MRSVGCSLGNYALNKAADGIEGGVEIGRDVRAWVSGLLPATDEQEPAVEGEETQAPETAKPQTKRAPRRSLRARPRRPLPMNCPATSSCARRS